MKPLGSNGRLGAYRDSIRDLSGGWTGEGGPDPRDRSPIEDPQWPFLNPTFPRHPYRLSEERSEIEPPRSPKKAWTERPPKSPKDITESDRPRSPKSPSRRYGRIGDGSGDFC